MVFFLAATFAFTYKGANIPGKLNDVTDALSRNRPHKFLSFLPQADHKATTGPRGPPLLASGSGEDVDIPSLETVLQRHCQGQPEGRMTQPNANITCHILVIIMMFTGITSDVYSL